jgi:alanine racemase
VARASALERTGVLKVAGLWTHLAEETDDDDSRSIAEHEAGVAVALAHGVHDPIVHVAASAASYARADARFDLVRVGAFLYGIAPGGGVGPADLGLRPVMTLQAPIRQVREGDGRILAEVPIGSASGILSDAAGSVAVALGGSRAPVIAVEPGYSLIDVTQASARPGDTVTLFGDGSAGEPTLQEWADAMGTIGEEIVTRLAVTNPRIVTGR